MPGLPGLPGLPEQSVIGLEQEVAKALEETRSGDSQAAERLLPLVYDQLRELARVRLAHEPPGLTLQATALVHEAYLRVAGGNPQAFEGRGHFFAAAAEAMRRILIERARRAGRKKHGGGRQGVALDAAEAHSPAPTPDERLLALDRALVEFERLDPERSQIVKLRYFAGLTLEQSAGVLGVSRATACRHWEYARAWLAERITTGGGDGP